MCRTDTFFLSIIFFVMNGSCTANAAVQDFGQLFIGTPDYSAHAFTSPVQTADYDVWSTNRITNNKKRNTLLPQKNMASGSISVVPEIVIDSAYDAGSYYAFSHEYNATWNMSSLPSNTLPGAAATTEPETYAMLLAGLCLVGLSARRRIDKD